MASKTGQKTAQIDFHELTRLLAVGCRQAEAARMLGIDVRRLRRFMDRDRTRLTEAVEAYRSEMLSASAGLLGDTMLKAIETLKSLLDSSSEKIKLGASRAIIDSALRLSELTKIENRLTALELSLKPTSGGTVA